MSKHDYPFEAEITVTAHILIDARDGSLISYVVNPKTIEAAITEAVIEQAQNMEIDR